MMTIFEKHEELKKEFDLAKRNLLDSEINLYNHFQKELDNMETGTFNREQEGYSIKIVKKNTVKVNQEKAMELDYGFTVKYGYSKTEYNKLDDNQKRMVDECLTETPAKPSFKVEKL